MAVQAPPPAPAPSSQSYNPVPPTATKRRGGCGCGGCLLSILLVVVLVVGAIWWFAIRAASAATEAPAVLTVYLTKVEVGRAGGSYSAARTGQQVSAQGSVRTDTGGRASLQFPDGSITRLAGDTELTVTEESLTAKGALNRVSIEQLSGRTFSSVQKLGPDSHFIVQGRQVSAEVRGTEFEVYLRADKTTLIKLFAGRLRVTGKGSADLSAGQQVVIAADGTVGVPGPIQPEPADPFASWTGPLGSETAALPGNQLGTVQTMPSATPLAATGAPVDTTAYSFPGGDLTATLSYPGSLMKLEVIGPSGQVVASGQGGPPVRVNLPNAPAGNYKGRVTALVLDHGPEAWTVTFAAHPPCRLNDPNAPPPAPGVPVRLSVSDVQLNQALAQSGVTGSSIQILPSANGAVVTGSLSAGGTRVSGTAVVYAAAPGIGVTVTQASLNGIGITSQVATQLARLRGTDLSALSTGFAVDRVYSCRGADGGLLVVEGHGQG